MAQRTLYYLVYTAANIQREVWYDPTFPNAGRLIGNTDTPISAQAGMEPDLATGEPEGGWPFAEGAVLDSFCEATDGVTLFATYSAPFAGIAVDSTAAACSATTPASCDLQGSAVWDADTELVTVTATSTHGPMRASMTLNGQSFPLDANGQIEFGTEPLATGAHSVYLTDAGVGGTPCRATASYTITRADPPGPPSGHFDSFTYNDTVGVFLFYVNDQQGRRVSVVLNPGNGSVPTTLSQAERTRAEGELLREFVEGANTVRLLASLEAPFATVVVTPIPPVPVLGCTDPDADNYNASATQDDGTCTYAPVDPTPDPIIGCMDELASNFNPLATQANNALCQYAPNWQPLWHADGIQVEVTPEPDATYVTAQLYAGYPAGHPLATGRPQVLIAALRAAASPRTGRATLQLAPYLRRHVGALQSDGTRRLDLNSPTALTEDLLVGYRVQVGTRTVARGYAVNSAASAAALEAGATRWPLSPFGLTLPAWPGYDYDVSVLSADVSGRYGRVEAVPHEADVDSAWVNSVRPCPRNGILVAWLAPGGGFGYWVFSGNHLHTDDIAEGQGYTEASTGEQRLSSRAGSREGMELYSGAYSQRPLVEGLRTLRRAVQAWYQPAGPGTEWIAITLRGGSFPAYREGRSRYETTIQFTEARPQYVQGQ